MEERHVLRRVLVVELRFVGLTSAMAHVAPPACVLQVLVFLPRNCSVVACPFLDQLAEIVVGAVHVRVVLGDVLACGAKQPFIVLGAQPVPAWAVDNAAHELSP